MDFIKHQVRRMNNLKNTLHTVSITQITGGKDAINWGIHKKFHNFFSHSSRFRKLGIHLPTQTYSTWENFKTQNGWGWKRPLETTSSNPSAQAVSPGAGHSSSCPHSFRRSLKRETPQPPWATCTSAQSLFTVNVSWSSGGTFPVPVCAHCL